MKIKLILAATSDDPLKKNDPFMPLSLPILAACAPENEYIFVDMLWDDKINFEEKVDLVGISYRITAQQEAFKIAEIFKKSGIKVVCGGAQPTSSPYEASKHFDAVVVGEAEPLWQKIIEDTKNNNLKKYYVASPHKFDPKNESLYQIDNFYDLHNQPKALRYIYKRHYDFDTVFASRGCSINCDFCSVPGMYGHEIRLRKIEDVVSEIDNFKNYYYLLDDTVFGRHNTYKYYHKLYQEIMKLKKIRFWTGQGNLDAASNHEGQEVIKLAAKSGLIYASIGMESINPVIIKKSGIIKKLGVKKPEDAIKKMKENIAFIQDQGIAVTGWFVVGYEEDHVETFEEILHFCKETKVIPIINALEALPNTRLYDNLKNENKISDTNKLNIIHPTMSNDDILENVRKTMKQGYSNKNIRERTLFYMNKFEKYNNDINQKISYKIHKTIFTHILQKKLRNGVIGLVNSGDSLL